MAKFRLLFWAPLFCWIRIIFYPLPVFSRWWCQAGRNPYYVIDIQIDGFAGVCYHTMCYAVSIFSPREHRSRFKKKIALKVKVIYKESGTTRHESCSIRFSYIAFLCFSFWYFFSFFFSFSQHKCCSISIKTCFFSPNSVSTTCASDIESHKYIYYICVYRFICYRFTNHRLFLLHDNSVLSVSLLCWIQMFAKYEFVNAENSECLRMIFQSKSTYFESLKKKLKKKQMKLAFQWFQLVSEERLKGNVQTNHWLS